MSEIIVASFMAMFLGTIYAITRTCLGTDDRLTELREFNLERQRRLQPAARSGRRWRH